MKPRRRRPIKTRAQTARAMAERAENAQAAAEGRELPYPNMWDRLDPTKVARDATPEQIHQRYLEFKALCHPKPRKKIVV